MAVGMVDLGAAFFIGLLGGVHCVGMCGGIAIALSAGRQTVWLPGVAVYHSARILTYALLGFVVSLTGTLIGKYAVWSGVQNAIFVFAGLVVIVFALQLGGSLPELLSGSLIRIPSLVLRTAGSKNSAAAWGAVGFFNGLLPCGLVYAALAVALASGGPVKGAVTMLVFGLGTLPALFSMSAVMRLVRPIFRARLVKVTAVLLLIYGGSMVARPFIGHSHGQHNTHAISQTAPEPPGESRRPAGD